MELDLFGSVVTVVLIAGFALLLIGVYPSKLRENSLNLIKHGLFSTVATVMTLVAVFALMVPVFLRIVGSTSAAGFFQFPIMWLHAVLGAISVGSALIMIAMWVKSPIGELGCAKAFRLMIPTLAIWAATIAVGIFIQIYGLM